MIGREGVVGLVAAALLGGCTREHERGGPGAEVEVRTPAPTEDVGGVGDVDDRSEPAEIAEYVGSEACLGCHDPARRGWTGSDHDRAMEAASPRSAAWDGRSFAAFGDTLRPRCDESGCAIEIAKGTATPRRYRVAHMLGVDPLQQPLLEVGDGRLQALTSAWDTRPAALGGQRWFELESGAALHWSGLAYTWNTQCVDCHSTGVSRGYDAVHDRYATRFAAADVGCEACHGPGSAHVGDPQVAVPRPLRRDPARRWVLDDGAAIARLTTAPDRGELEVCGPCHSRRSDLGPGRGARYDDRYRLALLEDPLYFADGQIHDEVFVLGSFMQSKMYAAGVVCSDCHEPHGLELRTATVTETCLGCHRTERYASPSHHAHAQGSEASRCESCHMPERVYMGVDGRRDHRFGVPQPRVSAHVGAPDPCLGCHGDRDAEWAEAEIAERVGGAEHRPRWEFATALWMARTEQLGAFEQLATIIEDSHGPVIIRASAVVELGRVWPSGAARARGLALLARARDSDAALLRRAVAEASGGLTPAEREPLVRPLLDDPVRSVRIEAVASLVGADRRGWSERDLAAWDRALADYEAAKHYDADRPEALVDLAVLDRLRADDDQARARLEHAIARDPSFTPAYLELADLERGREAALEAVLRRGLAHAGEPAWLHLALGLALIRGDQPEAALAQLEAAHALAPAEQTIAYTYAIADFELGDRDRALAVLAAAHHRHPANVELLAALVEFSRRAGQSEAAAGYAAELDALLR